MFVAPHQELKLRQVFFRGGKLHGARLSQSPGIDDQNYARFVITESLRSRRYLERKRLLGTSEGLDVCVVAGAAVAAEISALTGSDELNHFRFIDAPAASRKLGARTVTRPGHFEETYVSMAGRRRPKHSYASSGENRYWRMQCVRAGLISAAVVSAAVCSVLAAILFSDTWMLKNRIAGIQSQLDHMAETFRRENEKFNPIKADSHEMKLAVDTGDFILANRVPVPWVMNQLSAVMGDYPDIQVRQLRWLAESALVERAPVPQRSSAPAPIQVPAVRTVSAVMTADIAPFDGDMRWAFARIDALVSDLESNTDFTRAIAIEYPFDVSTSSAIAGDILRHRVNKPARFSVRVLYEVPLENSGPTGGGNDST